MKNSEQKFWPPVWSPGKLLWILGDPAEWLPIHVVQSAYQSDMVWNLQPIKKKSSLVFFASIMSFTTLTAGVIGLCFLTDVGKEFSSILQLLTCERLPPFSKGRTGAEIHITEISEVKNITYFYPKFCSQCETVRGPVDLHKITWQLLNIIYSYSGVRNDLVWQASALVWGGEQVNRKKVSLRAMRMRRGQSVLDIFFIPGEFYSLKQKWQNKNNADFNVN